MRSHGLALIAAAALSAACSDGLASPPARFTIAMVPDPQNYVSYDHQKAAGFPFDASEQFLEQMRYIAANSESQGGDIAFVSVVGDNWNHYSTRIDPEHEARGLTWRPNPAVDANQAPTPRTREIEMPMVRRAFGIIAGKVPFATVPGNHDYDAQWTDSRYPAGPAVIHVGGLDNFRSVFGADSEFFKGLPWYVDAFDGGAESAQIFEAGGRLFLHLALSFNPPDRALSWAASVMERYPGLPTIVTTHEYLRPDGEVSTSYALDVLEADPEDNSPRMLWEKFLSRHDQVFLLLCGHHAGQAYRVDLNASGLQVHQVLADYQFRWQSAREAGQEMRRYDGIGDGWLRLLTFDMAAPVPTIDIRTYSTHYRKLSGEVADYAKWYRPSEQPGMTDEQFLAAEEFRIELTDFRVRFDRSAEVRR
jgi:hypothetical protein